MPKNGSKMAKNALNDPIFGVQALKTSYFLITNVIGPIQGEKSETKYPPPQNPPNRSLCILHHLNVFIIYTFLINNTNFRWITATSQSGSTKEE